MKVFEYIGYKKYSLRVAAETQEQAEKKMQELGEGWINYAEEIGVEIMDGDNLLSGEDVKGDVEDVAHIIAERETS